MVMYYGIRSRGGVEGQGMWYSLYFIILVLFGNCILFMHPLQLVKKGCIMLWRCPSVHVSVGTVRRCVHPSVH
jgi:hypothetical protein